LPSFTSNRTGIQADFRKNASVKEKGQLVTDSTAFDLPTVRTIRELRAQIQNWRAEGQSVALVPTMGALHEGHLSLVDIAKNAADKVVASLFVNPAQFAPGEDLMSYPRNEADDTAKFAERNVDLLFAPPAEEMYQRGFSTTISVSGVGQGLETTCRPHFFIGVATVVTKLLLQVMPDCAVFGEKDYQQLLVIRRLVADLDMPVEIIGGPIIREANGLAMSSRNVNLGADQWETSGRLNVVLNALSIELEQGMNVTEAMQAARAALLRAGFGSIDYLELCDAETLEPVQSLNSPSRILAAVRLGAVRLLDNMAVAVKT
jgi:pantoate--beta-alanine ligase